MWSQKKFKTFFTTFGLTLEFLKVNYFYLIKFLIIVIKIWIFNIAFIKYLVNDIEKFQ